jgi:N-acetylmuramoyl-L-alanine amidase
MKAAAATIWRPAVFSRALFVLLALFALALAGEALAQPSGPAAPGKVIGVRVSSTPERARLIVDLSRPTEFAIATLSEPDRIAIDVRMSELAVASPPPVAGEEGLVNFYSIGLFETDRVRTLLTLSAPAQVQQAYVLDAVADQPARLVVDLIADTPEAFAERAAANLAASRAASQSVAGAPVPDMGEPSTPPAAGPPVPVKPLVVIDPGHGGIDNGASAPNGLREKDIVLGYAKQLQALLMASGRFDVALTREDDTYLTLEARVALARQNKADLFVSLHADSFQQSDIRGASVYTRDERATDVLDKVLAENENRRDIVAGFAMPQMDAQVVDILVDLMRREMRRQSFLAAQAIVHQLEPSVTLRRFPVRQADFFVLQAPDVPSVLVELGFLSNAADIKNLLTAGWRDRTVDALARGIAQYFDGLGDPTLAALAGR